MSQPEVEKKTPAPPVPETLPSRPPQPSQIDRERGDWEGMGQGRFQPPEVEEPKPEEQKS